MFSWSGVELEIECVHLITSCWLKGLWLLTQIGFESKMTFRSLEGDLMARAARQISIDPSTVQIVHVSRERLEHLASIFGVDCLAFAILSNHTHQILRSRPDIVATWSDREVAPVGCGSHPSEMVPGSRWLLLSRRSTCCLTTQNA